MVKYQSGMMGLRMSCVVPELYQSSCTRAAEILEKGAKGGALLSLSCKRYMLGIKKTIPRHSNKMQLLRFVFLLMAASAQTTLPYIS